MTCCAIFFRLAAKANQYANEVVQVLWLQLLHSTVGLLRPISIGFVSLNLPRSNHWGPFDRVRIHVRRMHVS